MTVEERMDSARCHNEIQRNHIANITSTGVSILHVMEGSNPSTPQWSYTIGLWHSYKHPEIVIVGLRGSLTSILLNNLNASIRVDGQTFVAGTSASDVIEGYRCHFQEISSESYGDWLLGNEWFYGDKSFPAVQMLWPNTSGVYPWDKEANEYLRWAQPVLSSLSMGTI